ncbi:MAG: LPS export ABC transporter periplasmic protein LptC [Ferruginibacter sp.]
MAVPLLCNTGRLKASPKDSFWRGSYRKTIFICIAVWLLLAALLSSCGNSYKEVKDINSRGLGVEEIKNADINYTLGGKAKAKLLSPLMLRVQDNMPYVEFPNTLHVDFYNDTAGIDSRLDAHYGKYLELDSRVFLKDSVVVINVLGDTLYCTELWWDRNKTGNEFYTDKPVRIRRKMEVINGTGMQAAQDFKNWVILNPSQGLMKIPASEFPAN